MLASKSPTPIASNIAATGAKAPRYSMPLSGELAVGAAPERELKAQLVDRQHRRRHQRRRAEPEGHQAVDLLAHQAQTVSVSFA